MAQKTALYDLHVELGGKVVDFAGFELPIQYSKGIIFEHNCVREGVGLFDVSHMGEVFITGENATSELQNLVTNRVDTMVDNQCRYTLMCYEDGGIVDDLLIYKFNNNKYLLVVNASNIDKDYEWIASHLVTAKAVNHSDKISQIAIQGRDSIKVLDKLCDSSLLPTKNYHFIPSIVLGGKEVLISTTGYTGEAGYEIYCKNSEVVEIYRDLLQAGEEYNIQPIGLGARDTLRFEASMPLYGHELTAKTKLNEVSLNFFINKDMDYIGKSALNNPPQHKRIGLKLIDKGIAREHFEVFDLDNNLIGMTSSGGVCPTIGGSYAMAIVDINYNQDKVLIQVRNRKLLAEVVSLPFYKKNY